MRETSRTVLANGGTKVTVVLEPGEKLLAVKDDRHYSLAYPMEDVVPGHVIADAVPVTWCCLEQKWVS
jgi:hypothetical protein